MNPKRKEYELSLDKYGNLFKKIEEKQHAVEFFLVLLKGSLTGEEILQLKRTRSF